MRHTRGVDDFRSPAPRLATTTDAADIARLLDAFNREFDEPTPGPEVLEERLIRLLAADNVIALVAGDPPIGLALVTLRTNVWYDGLVGLLDELYVAPGIRGGGYGSELLWAAETVARERGAELMEINVDGEDVDARRFYERHGYACQAPGEPEPALYYSRELS
jgi:GNAT superfamily N-acetyltransferase